MIQGLVDNNPGDCRQQAGSQIREPGLHGQTEPKREEVNRFDCIDSNAKPEHKQENEKSICNHDTKFLLSSSIKGAYEITENGKPLSVKEKKKRRGN